jgi:hypothetical protein
MRCFFMAGLRNFGERVTIIGDEVSVYDAHLFIQFIHAGALNRMPSYVSIGGSLWSFTISPCYLIVNSTEV